MSRKPPGSPANPLYLAEWRRFRGLTQERLAELCGASDKSWVSKRENGETTTLDDLVKIGKSLNCKPEDLFSPPPDIKHEKKPETGYSTSARLILSEGNMTPRDHMQLVDLVLSLPIEAVPTVGALIEKLMATRKDKLAHPHKGEIGA